MNSTIANAGEHAGLAALLVLVGSFLKQVPKFPDNWIPTALALIGCGVSLGVNGVNIASATSGLLTGMAAVGANQLYRQHTKNNDSTPPSGGGSGPPVTPT